MAITTVHNELIAVNAISGTAIADNAVTSVHIAKNNIGTVQIAQNSVTSVSIALNNVTGTQIAMNSITSTQLADNAVTATKIPDGTQLALGATTFSGDVTAEADGAEIFLKSADHTVARIIPRGTGGDLDKGLLSLFDAGTEDVRIDTAGNSWFTGGSVGIGTTSPAYELEVKASTDASINIRAGTSSGDFAGLYFGDTDYPAEGRITYQNSDNKMRFWSDRQHVMTLDDNARVGIGTESPDDLLDVENGNIRLRSNSEGNTGLLRMFDASGTESAQIYPASGDLKIYSPNDVLFTQSGNVGIGTASPSKPLHIYSADNQPVRIESSDAYAGLELKDNTSNASPPLISGVGDAMVFYQHNGTAYGERMRIHTDGKVGINKNDPSAYLDVHAPSGVSGPTVAYFKSDQHGLGVYINVESTYSEIRSNNNSYPLVLNKGSGGNVGIGSSTPTKGKLQIDGGSGGSGDFDAIAIKHVNTTTTGDGPVIRFEGEYNSSDWQLAEMKATNGGAGYGANFQIRTHAGNSVQGGATLSAFALQRTVSNQLEMTLHAGGASTYADNASYTINSIANTSCLISIQSSRKAGGNSIAYDAALFFCHYGIDSGTSVIELADPGGTFVGDDNNGFVCVFKANNSPNVTIKNRLGYSTTLSIQVIKFIGN